MHLCQFILLISLLLWTCVLESSTTQKILSVPSVTMQIFTNRVSILMNHVTDLLHQYLEFVINDFENILEKTHFMILTVSIARHPCHVCY